MSKKVLTKASDKLRVLAFSAYAVGNSARAEALYEAAIIVDLDLIREHQCQVKMK